MRGSIFPLPVYAQVEYLCVETLSIYFEYAHYVQCWFNSWLRAFAKTSHINCINLILIFDKNNTDLKWRHCIYGQRLIVEKSRLQVTL